MRFAGAGRQDKVGRRDKGRAERTKDPPRYLVRRLTSTPSCLFAFTAGLDSSEEQSLDSSLVRRYPPNGDGFAQAPTLYTTKLR